MDAGLQHTDSASPHLSNLSKFISILFHKIACTILPVSMRGVSACTIQLYRLYIPGLYNFVIRTAVDVASFTGSYAMHAIVDALCHCVIAKK